MNRDADYTFTEYNSDLMPNARSLRRKMTPQETMLWYGFLKQYPVRIYRQRVIDQFIADFYCSRAKLVIELDGGQHYTADGLAWDQERTEILKTLGIKVLRFSNIQIEQNFKGVCRAVDTEIKLRIQQLTESI